MFKMNIEETSFNASLSVIISKVIHAVEDNDIDELRDVLNDLNVNQRISILNNTTIYGRSLLHRAVLNRFTEMAKFLLLCGAKDNICRHTGRTALHDAVRTGNVEITSLFLKTKEFYDESDGLGEVDLAYNAHSEVLDITQKVNLKDKEGLTPLLLLTDVATITEGEFTTIVILLLEAGADTKLIHPGNGQTVLFRAVELQSQPATSYLLGAGADVNVQDRVGDTVLHLSARQDCPKILQMFLESSRKSINIQNRTGNTPLHCAAFAGSRQCLNLLLNFGGNLSIENNDTQTVVESILSNIPRPASFLTTILDSKVTSNNHSINDRQFEMTIDFSVLSPKAEEQMDVTVAIMNSLRTIDRKKVLQHPIIETYLHFKWTRLKIFFIGLFLVHLAFVLSLSAHVILLLYPGKENEFRITLSRRILLGTASILIAHLATQIALASKYFFHEPETWVSVTSVSMAFVMSVCGEFGIEHSESSIIHEIKWIRHVASFTILLAWGELMFILSRFPSIGLFALMFFTVMKNVVKALIIYACLVIGFSLSFCIQLNSFEYDGAWSAFVRTTVMMMGEYNYADIFKPNNMDSNVPRRWSGEPNYLPFSSHFVFLLFVFLGSVVLMNLMIGMAVNDIQGIQAEGTLRHLIKQADFLLHMDRVLSIVNFCKTLRSIPSTVKINPSTINKIRENKYRRLGLNIPSQTIHSLVKIALKNKRKLGERALYTPSIARELMKEEYSSESDEEVCLV